MEIIQHGSTAKEFTCECGCRFIASKVDFKLEQNYYIHKTRRYVNCPECLRVIEESKTEWED